MMNVRIVLLVAAFYLRFLKCVLRSDGLDGQSALTLHPAGSR